MSDRVIFQHQSEVNCNNITINNNSILFHGNPVDDRGESIKSIKTISDNSKILVAYDHDTMTISIADKSISADLAGELISPLIKGKNIVLESTTLGFAELFLLIRSLVDLGIKKMIITYVEPQKYNRAQPGSDSFALSALNAGYKPIPRSIVDLSGDDVEAGVFFLGFEPERIERAFEEYQMISHMDIKVVFGIPAFHPGWELNSIVPHLNSIDNCDIQYCAANDPSSAFDALEITKASLQAEKKMFVAPIGTKPCGIAAAIFASIYSGNVGILFDHRVKKNKRSEGVGLCHGYSITIK